MSGDAFNRAIGEWKVQCSLYLKFKKGELSFTLKEAIDSAGLANFSFEDAKTIIQNAIMGQMFTIRPEITDNSSLNDEFSLNFNPLMENGFLGRLDGILQNIQKTYSGPVDSEVEKLQGVIDAAIQEQNPERKVQRIFAILVDFSSG